MLMYVEMDFNLVQMLTNCYRDSVALCFYCFVQKNWFVFDGNFNSPDNQDWLFFKYYIILADWLHVEKISMNVD